MRSVVSVIGGLAVLAAFVAMPQAMAAQDPQARTLRMARQSDQPAFNSIPTTLPGTVASLGFEAQSISEFGNQAGLVATTGGQRNLRSMRVVMTSGACQTRAPQTLHCTTVPGATFSEPITANIYAVDNSGVVPAPGVPPLATVTQTFNIPYRPSQDDVNCTGGNAGKWFDTTTGTCFSSIADTIQFDFPAGASLPSEVIWTVAFNTTNHGYNPIGPMPCNATPAGCGYNSLNVGVQTFPGQPSVGTVADPNGAYINASNPNTYCNVGQIDVLRFTTSAMDCFTGFLPLAEILIAGAADPIDPGHQYRRPHRTQHRPHRNATARAVNRQHDRVNLDYTQGHRHHGIQGN